LGDCAKETLEIEGVCAHAQLLIKTLAAKHIITFKMMPYLFFIALPLPRFLT
jgi:hypothetical protein